MRQIAQHNAQLAPIGIIFIHPFLKCIRPFFKFGRLGRHLFGTHILPFGSLCITPSKKLHAFFDAHRGNVHAKSRFAFCLRNRISNIGFGRRIPLRDDLDCSFNFVFNIFHR